MQRERETMWLWLLEQMIESTGCWRSTSALKHALEGAAGEEFERIVNAAETLHVEMRLTPMLPEEFGQTRTGMPWAVLDRQGSVWLLWWSKGEMCEVESWEKRGQRQHITLEEWSSLLGIALDGRVWGLSLNERYPMQDWVEKKEGKIVPASTWYRLRAFLRSERRDVGLLVFYACGIGLLTLATPVAVQALVNTVAFGTLIQPLVILAMLLAGGLGFSAMLKALQVYVAEYMAQRIFVRTVLDFSARLTRMTSDFQSSHYGPSLLNRFFDVLTVQKGISALFFDGLSSILQICVALLLLSVYHPFLLAFALFLLVFIMLLVFVVGRGALGTSVYESKAKHRVAEWLQEMSLHPSIFRDRLGAAWGRDYAEELARDYVTKRSKHFRIVFRQFVATLGLQILANTGVLVVGGWLVIQRQLTLGQLVASELVISAAVVSMTKLVKQFEKFYDLMASLDKLGQVLDMPMQSKGLEAYEPTSLRMGLSLQGLSLSVEPRGQIWSDINAEIRPGEAVGFVGPTGSGKSLLLDVIAGRRIPSSGRVSIDKQELRELEPESVFQHVVLLREVEIIYGSILDNLSLGRTDITRTMAREALSWVGLWEDIQGWPEGLDTVLTVGGAPLSSRQKVLLMFARALITSPRLLIVDGLLDLLTEQRRYLMLEGLRRAQMPWTLILVSNLEDVLSRCDRIFRLEDGWCIEEKMRQARPVLSAVPQVPLLPPKKN